MDFNDSIDSVVATDSNSDFNATLPILILFLLLRNPGLQPQSYRKQLQLQYQLSASSVHETISNVLFKILVTYYSRKFLFLLGLPTISMLIIYFSCHRLMEIIVNFRNQISCCFVTKFVATTHLLRYKIFSSIAFSNVLTISVAIILPSVPIAVTERYPMGKSLFPQ